MKVLVATEKPFAKVAVDGIRKEIEAAGYELALLEKYTDKAQLLDAVKDANAIIIRSDIIDAEVLDAAKELKIVVRAGAGYEEAGNRLDETTAKTLAEAYLGQNEKTLEVSMQWIHYDNLQITKSDYEQLTERMKKYGINKNPPSYEDFVYQPESSESD